jgi:hypothetical protein
MRKKGTKQEQKRKRMVIKKSNKKGEKAIKC